MRVWARQTAAKAMTIREITLALFSLRYFVGRTIVKWERDLAEVWRVGRRCLWRITIYIPEPFLVINLTYQISTRQDAKGQAIFRCRWTHGTAGEIERPVRDWEHSESRWSIDIRRAKNKKTLEVVAAVEAQ